MADAKKPPARPGTSVFGVAAARDKTPNKITGMTPTHQLDNERAGKELSKAKARSKLNPEGELESAGLERAFMVARTFTVYREALKWVKLAGVDTKAKRVSAGHPRYIPDAESLLAELKALKRHTDQALELQPEGLPETLLQLLDRCTPLVESLKP